MLQKLRNLSSNDLVRIRVRVNRHLSHRFTFLFLSIFKIIQSRFIDGAERWRKDTAAAEDKIQQHRKSRE